jgi:hypothetical protein
MQEVTVEPALGEKLGQLAGQAILCDPEGRVLGFFSPFRDRPKRDELQLEPPWSIFWSPNAESQLEAILGEVAQRLEMANAARDIDGHVMSNPLAFGESRYDDVRIGFVLPLASNMKFSTT